MKKLLLALLLCVSSTFLFGEGTFVPVYPTQSFNTVFQANDTYPYTLDAISVSIACHLTISGGETGTIFFEVSEDGSTNWIEVSRVSNSLTGSLVIGVSITDTKTFVLTGVIPPFWYARLRTSASGSPTFTFVRSQESGYY